MLKKLLPVFILPLLFAGCATVTPVTLTNLTPLQQLRSTNNLYQVEVALATRQQTLRWRSIKPQILVGSDLLPMRPTPILTNRWEGLIPVPPGASTVEYRYKFEYEVNTFGPPKIASATSPAYTLRIVDQP